MLKHLRNTVLETGKRFRSIRRLSRTDKENIVAGLRQGQTIKELAAHYGVGETTITRAVVQMTGRPLTGYRESTTIKLTRALQQRKYRAWQNQEQKMYEVLGIDWFNKKLLLATNGVPAWCDMTPLTIMEYTGLRDRKRTPEYPEGQEICVGDIVQFPILLKESDDGEYKDTIVKDTVAFDRELAGFTVSELDDPLAMHSNECEIIGNIYANPELLSETKTMPDNLSLTLV